MMIYPTMEIQNRHCVSLDRGRLDEPTIWHVDPVATAKGFAAAGAEWMHLTDLNAVTGDYSNEELITSIIRGAGIPVQLGGGMRSREHIEHWIDKGAGRIVIGTLAAREPHMVKDLIIHHPDQIVLSVDIFDGQVMTDGWRHSGAITPADFIAAFDTLPLAGIIITDIDSDITDVEAQLGLISGLAEKARTPVIASGVVRNKDDISRLKYVYNIDGALVGRALFRKTLTVKEALAVARPEPEPMAEFQ